MGKPQKKCDNLAVAAVVLETKIWWKSPSVLAPKKKVLKKFGGQMVGMRGRELGLPNIAVQGFFLFLLFPLFFLSVWWNCLFFNFPFIFIFSKISEGRLSPPFCSIAALAGLWRSLFCGCWAFGGSLVGILPFYLLLFLLVSGLFFVLAKAAGMVHCQKRSLFSYLDVGGGGPGQRLQVVVGRHFLLGNGVFCTSKSLIFAFSWLLFLVFGVVGAGLWGGCFRWAGASISFKLK